MSRTVGPQLDPGGSSLTPSAYHPSILPSASARSGVFLLSMIFILEDMISHSYQPYYIVIAMYLAFRSQRSPRTAGDPPAPRPVCEVCPACDPCVRPS